VRSEATETKGESATSFRIVACAATVLFLALSFGVQGGVAKYRYSFLFLVPILWGVLALRRPLALDPWHFGFFAGALLLHDLAAFGLYSRTFLGLRYDWIVHFAFGCVGGLIVARALSVRLELRGLILVLFVVLLVTGVGGVHEIVEWASTLMLGKEYGMLNVGATNPYDTQQDLLNNVLGSITACGLRLLPSRARGERNRF
jgi:hypothetical protein